MSADRAARERKALAEIKVILKSVRKRVKAGCLLPEEGIALIGDVLDELETKRST